MKNRSRAGVTLIEVLIAVSLFSLLSVGIMVALRVGLSALGKANARLMLNRRVAGAQRVLQQQIEGFMPVVAQCGADPNVKPVKMGFFQGERQSMRFVSSYSLQEASRGMPRLLEFQVIPGDQGVGVRLVVNEHLYTGPLGAGLFCMGRALDPALGVETPRFRPIQAGPGSFVLADKLAFCQFSFLEALPAPVLERWRPNWVLAQWPLAIRIDMAPLDNDPSRLRPLTLTAQLHVNRYPIFEYADQ